MKKSVIAATILLIGLSACNKKDNTPEESVRPVKYATVSYQNSSEIRSFSGTAETEVIVNLSFRNSGILTDLNIKLGQEVKKGRLLAKLDNVQAQLAYESAQEQMNSAESQMKTAKLNLERVRNLYEKGVSSLSDYENAKNAYRTGSAAFESAKRTVGLQKEQLTYGYIYAPEDGFISEVNVELDENIAAGQVVGVLNVGSSMEINLGMPETIINKVKHDMEVEISFPSIKDTVYHGTVYKISSAVDPVTSTYPVEILMTDEDEKVKSGMAAEVKFDFYEHVEGESKLTVPQQSIGEDGKGRFVFLINAKQDTGVIAKQYVTIGDLTEEGFEVKDGLKSGDKIATAGLQTLLDGQKVLLTE